MFTFVYKIYDKIVKKGLFYICVAVSALLMPTALSAQRIERTINEAWRFTRDGAATEVVNIPHSWNRYDTTDDTPGYFRGLGVYEKVLRVNETIADHSFYLHFEGANQITELWVNDKYVGKHIGGYSAFCFDVSNYLHEGDNLLKVKVDNSHNADIPPLSADFTFFGGIYRDVNLVVTSKTHISTTHYASSGVYISTSEVSERVAKVQLRTMLTNNGAKKATAFVCHKIVSPDGRVVREVKSKVSLAPKTQNIEHSLECVLEKPLLWSPDTPHLYKVYTSLCDKNGNVLDKVLNAMGVRSFTLDAERGFFINGKRFKLLGTNRHQDYVDEANALSDARHMADLRDIKALGSNFLRISHYPQDRLVPQMCDRLGMVASIEIPIVNAVTPSEAFQNNSLEMIREMVYQDFNSPSVMIWAYMNEVLLRLPVNKKDEAAVTAYYAEVCKQAKAIEDLLDEIDPSRLTMLPCHSSWRRYRDSGLLRLPDIVGWNVYFGWYSATTDSFARFVEKIRANFPDKGLMISEYGADMDARLHTMRPERFDYTCEYGEYFHRRYISEILKRDYVVGANVWNYADFHSEARTDGIPHINNKGLIELNREKKDAYRLHKAAYSNDLYVEVGGKAWRNRGGVTTDGVCRQHLSVFSNADKVELFHNGRSLGSADVVDFVAEFDVPFVDGVNSMKAIASKAGKSVEDSAELRFKGYPKMVSADFDELNVMLGTVRYFDDRKDNIAWIPEQEYCQGSWGYVGGEANRPLASDRKSTLPATMNIDFPNIENDPLWQTQRKGLQSFKADVPDGKYCVELYFAEWESDKKKEALAYLLGGGAASSEGATNRLFDVAINGNKVLCSFDIAAEVGAEYGIVKKFSVDVDGGNGLSIDFTPIKGEPTLCAIRIYRVF